MIQLSGLSISETSEIVPSNTVLLGYVGSIAHGTYVPKNDPDSIDDKDIMGVCVGPIESYFGLGHFEQKQVQMGEWDSVVYEIRKFFRLLLKQNPNVIGLLYLKKENYIHISDAGQMIIDNKNLFVSKQAYRSFTGYAYSQLHRMTHSACEGYMGAKRKRLVETFGYDCKNAAHLIRLLRMGIEFLTDGKMYVFREDAPELKDIKSGKWELERVKEEADRLFKLSQEAYIRSELPVHPKTREAEELLIKILKLEIYN